MLFLTFVLNFKKQKSIQKTVQPYTKNRENLIIIYAQLCILLGLLGSLLNITGI